MTLDSSLDIKDLEKQKFVAVSSNLTAVRVLDSVSNSLVPDCYDYISLSYTDSNLTTVVFKIGGASGTTVSTLTLAYTGTTVSNLVSVTKT